MNITIFYHYYKLIQRPSRRWPFPNVGIDNKLSFIIIIIIIIIITNITIFYTRPAQPQTQLLLRLGLRLGRPCDVCPSLIPQPQIQVPSHRHAPGSAALSELSRLSTDLPTPNKTSG